MNLTCYAAHTTSGTNRQCCALTPGDGNISKDRPRAGSLTGTHPSGLALGVNLTCRAASTMNSTTPQCCATCQAPCTRAPCSRFRTADVTPGVSYSATCGGGFGFCVQKHELCPPVSPLCPPVARHAELRAVLRVHHC